MKLKITGSSLLRKLKGVFILIALILIFSTSSGQEITINGERTNRKLVWSDFKGKAESNSSYSANTRYTISYSFDGIKANGDIKNLLVKLEFIPERSWVKPEAKSAELLIHEQGHFNIAILCMNNIVRVLKAAKVNKHNANRILKKTFNQVMNEYNNLGLEYDRETDHSLNKKIQLEWNDFINEKLKSNQPILLENE